MVNLEARATPFLCLAYCLSELHKLSTAEGSIPQGMPSTDQACKPVTEQHMLKELAAPAATWLFVSSRPSGVMKNPDPTPALQASPLALPDFEMHNGRGGDVHRGCDSP